MREEWMEEEMRMRVGEKEEKEVEVEMGDKMMNQTAELKGEKEIK